MGNTPSSSPSPSPEGGSGGLGKAARRIALGAALGLSAFNPNLAEAKDTGAEVANKGPVEAAKAALKDKKFSDAKVYKQGQPEFDDAIKFIQGSKDDTRNSSLDPKQVLYIVSLTPEKGKEALGNVVVALGSGNRVLGIAD